MLEVEIAARRPRIFRVNVQIGVKTHAMPAPLDFVPTPLRQNGTAI
jgi:hypothetical protein